MDNRLVLVTGGARGIGAGIAGAFARAGNRVMVADIGVDTASMPEESDAWRYAFASEADIAGVQAVSDNIQVTHVDVTDAASCEAAVQATLDAFGGIDVLVNNAGVVDSGSIDSFSEESWERIFAVNCKGIFLMTRAALPSLKSSSDPAVVNTASIAGKQGHANMSAYCGSKFAAIGITQSLAQELAPFNIRVNALCPGVVGTAMWLDHLLPSNATSKAQREEEFTAAMQERMPLGRPQNVEDMGQAALYLASAPNVSGVALNVAGGYEMH
jgi:meso-butanediol dehydrogenase/(S,S)-butanediol dehydrogenase/diacetyl reductase